MMSMRRRQAGLSLIELMIAVTLGTILLIGVLRVFAASSQTARMAEGVGRVQESARIGLDFIQHDLRMVGHAGCVNDVARRQTTKEIPTTILYGANQGLNFNVGIMGYEATGTGPKDRLTLGSTAAKVTLPTWITDLKLTPAPLAGSDVLAVQFFAPVGVPVQSIAYTRAPSGKITAARLSMDPARWNSAMPTGGYDNAAVGLFAISDCAGAAIFQGNNIAVPAPGAAGGKVDVTATANVGLNQDLGNGFALLAGQTMLYRLESEIFYVGRNASGNPALYRARLIAPGNATALSVLAGAPEEIVEGVDSMQVLYGIDFNESENEFPAGFVARQGTATDVQASGAWRRVNMVQVALLGRSVERAASPAQPENRTMLGMGLTLPEDGYYRSVYESTIALRNRLFGD